MVSCYCFQQCASTKSHYLHLVAKRHFCAGSYSFTINAMYIGLFIFVYSHYSHYFIGFNNAVLFLLANCSIFWKYIFGNNWFFLKFPIIFPSINFPLYGISYYKFIENVSVQIGMLKSARKCLTDNWPLL